MLLTYCGVHDAVDVAVPEWRTVVNGEPTEVPDAIALDLLEQTESWAKSPTETAAEKAARLKREKEEADTAATEGNS